MVIDLQLANFESQEVPARRDINRWVSQTFEIINKAPQDLTVRVVDETEITDLNNRYRGKNTTTNVLAFSFDSQADLNLPYLGDIVVCFPVVRQEAKQRQNDIRSHFARMVVHGTLHLCGYDHQSDDEAEQMEILEKGILDECGLTFYP